MSREELVQMLTGLAMPLAPTETLTDREARRTAWHDSLSLQSLDALVALLRQPPVAESIYPVTVEDFEFEVIESLTSIGVRKPGPVVKRIGPLLAEAPARAALIEILGAMPAGYSMPWLAPVIQSEEFELNEDELIRLVCALGELGGATAQTLLEQIQASQDVSSSALKREIEIAMRNL